MGIKLKLAVNTLQPLIQKNISNKSIMFVGVIVVALIIEVGLGYYIFTSPKRDGICTFHYRLYFRCFS